MRKKRSWLKNEESKSPKRRNVEDNNVLERRVLI